MFISPHIDHLKSRLLGRRIYDELYVEEFLAHGSFGAVFRVVDRDSARQLALKVMHKSSRWEEESTIHYFLSKHPNIVTLHENVELDDYAASLLDYCPGGSLHDLIYDHLAYAGHSAGIKYTFLQIIDAVEHCHTNYIYHRDLKPLNVLCNDDGSKVFLTDFGLATRDYTSHEHGLGTAPYMSPECYHEKHSCPKQAPYSPEANDVWSLGVLFLDLACGDRIWETPTIEDDRYRRFREDPAAFLRSEYPLNRQTRHLLLRIFSPERHRISLRALREEVRSIDDFYLSDCEIASSSAQVQKNAMRYGPWTNLIEDCSRLAKVLHEYGVEDFSTNSDSDSSVGELVEISLTTPQNESSQFYAQCMKDQERFTPYIADIYPLTY